MKGFECAECGNHDWACKDTRHLDGSRSLTIPHWRRRRECTKCGTRISTVEIKVELFDALIMAAEALNSLKFTLETALKLIQINGLKIQVRSDEKSST